MPSSEHEGRVAVLDTLAVLAGFATDARPRVLPDGSRPDVLRVDQLRRRIFIGDGKASETPGREETRRRLRHYAAWGVRASGYGEVTLALCVGRPSDAGRWATLLRDLSRETKVRGLSVAEIETDLVIAITMRSLGA
jgi:hypothetical protein